MNISLDRLTCMCLVKRLQAKSPEDGELGLLFMQEMLELTKSQNMNHLTQLQVSRKKIVTHHSKLLQYEWLKADLNRSPFSPAMQAVYFKNDDQTLTVLMAGPSHFSPELVGDNYVESETIRAVPYRMCSKIENPDALAGKIAIGERGDCTFVDKSRRAEKAGAKALIICDNVVGSSSDKQPMFAMSGDGENNVTIPIVFMFSTECETLYKGLGKLKQEKPVVRIMQMLEFRKRMESSSLRSSAESTKIDGI